MNFGKIGDTLEEEWESCRERVLVGYDKDIVGGYYFKL